MNKTDAEMIKDGIKAVKKLEAFIKSERDRLQKLFKGESDTK